MWYPLNDIVSSVNYISAKLGKMEEVGSTSCWLADLPSCMHQVCVHAVCTK